MKTKFISKHILVPKHVKLSEKEKKELLERYRISERELPKISEKDPAISHLKVKSSDVVKIIRESSTAGATLYYRCVIHG